MPDLHYVHLTNPLQRIYYFSSYQFHKTINIFTGGSSQKALTIEKFEKINIPIPTFPEQQKIAQILSTWDRAIEKYELLIKKYELRKKGLMQQLPMEQLLQ